MVYEVIGYHSFNIYILYGTIYIGGVTTSIGSFISTPNRHGTIYKNCGHGKDYLGVFYV